MIGLGYQEIAGGNGVAPYRRGLQFTGEAVSSVEMLHDRTRVTFEAKASVPARRVIRAQVSGQDSGVFTYGETWDATGVGGNGDTTATVVEVSGTPAAFYIPNDHGYLLTVHVDLTSTSTDSRPIVGLYSSDDALLSSPTLVGEFGALRRELASGTIFVLHGAMVLFPTDGDPGKWYFLSATADLEPVAISLNRTNSVILEYMGAGASVDEVLIWDLGSWDTENSA